MDVKNFLLHGDLDEEIYMEQPQDFELKGKESYVRKLKKSFYGIKQTPRQWYKVWFFYVSTWLQEDFFISLCFCAKILK